MKSHTGNQIYSNCIPNQKKGIARPIASFSVGVLLLLNSFQALPAEAVTVSGGVSVDQVDFDLEHLDITLCQEADQLLERGHVEEAFKKYSEALRLNPNNLQARFGHALILRYKGEFGAAISDLTILIGKKFEVATCSLLRGLCYQALKDVEHAIADFESAAVSYKVAGDRRGARVASYFVFDHYRQQGEEQAFNAEYQSALVSFNKAIKYWAESPALFVDRSIVRFILNDTAGAFNDLSIALQMAPLDARSLVVRAQMNYIMGKHDAAIDDARAALVIDPRETGAQTLVAASLVALGRDEEAKIEYAKLEKMKAERGENPQATLVGQELDKLMFETGS